MKKSETKSNIYLFFGEDGFSLKRKIDLWKTEFAKKYSAQSVSFLDAADLPENDLIKSLQTQIAPTLFSNRKLVIIRDALPKKADQEKLVEFLLDLPNQVPKDFIIVFWQTQRPDGRLKFTKEFKSKVEVTEFVLPHGIELNGWIKAMAKNLGATIDDRAADLLAEYLGRDQFEEKKAGGRVVERKEAFDLWAVFSELSKLASATDTIQPDTVKSLVQPRLPDSVFLLSDSLAAKNYNQALKALDNHLAGTSGDEKTAFIKIIGLLTEQFRSLLLVGLMIEQGMNNQAIAEKLGWSSGRVFVLSKHAKNFSFLTLKKYLNQLLAIDVRLKSSDANPRLLMDMFVAN